MLVQKKEYLDYLKTVKRYSKNSLKNYRVDLNQFEKYLNQVKISSLKATTMDIERFKSVLNSKYQATTVNRRLAGVRAYYKYLYKIGLIKQNPAELVESVKVQKKLPVYLNEKEIKQLLKTINNTRDKLIIELFITTGLRKEEARNIKLEDINLGKNTILILGKGNKYREVSLAANVRKTLDKYLKERKSNSTYLFISREGNQISSTALHNVIIKYSNRAGLQGVTPHTLRHTCGTILYKKTKDIRLVQEYLGHENITTTQRYIHIDEEVSKGADIMGAVI